MFGSLGRRLPKHVFAGQGLHKDRVRTRVHVELGTGDCIVHAFDGHRIGPRDDHQVAARLDGGRDFGRHVARVNEVLAVQVSAFLGQHLILDVHGARTNLLKGAHHVHDVERLAIAGIAVDEQWKTSCANDLAHKEGDFLHRDDAEVGQAHGSGHRRAR